MKKNILIICYIMLASITSFGQNGKFKNMTPQNRAKAYTELMHTYLNMNRDQTVKVASINLKSAIEMEKVKRDEISIMVKWNKAMKIQKQREKAFKSILTKEQLEKYFKKKKEMIHQLQN